MTNFHSFSWLSNIPFHSIFYTFFVHSSINGHLRFLLYFLTLGFVGFSFSGSLRCEVSLFIWGFFWPHICGHVWACLKPNRALSIWCLKGWGNYLGKDAFLEGKKEGDNDLIFRRKQGFWVQLGVLLSADDLFSSLESHGLLPMGSDLWTHVCKSLSGHEEGQLWIKTERGEWLVFSQTPFVLVLIDVAIYKK